MKRLARKFATLILRWTASGGEVGSFIWRDQHGAGLMFHDENRMGYVRYFTLEEAHEFGRVLVVACRQHLEHHPLEPLEPM